MIGLVSSAITVTLPIESPTAINLTLLGGGSLVENNTYYYVMVNSV